MKTYLSNQIKNFALLGNSGSGKTTLAEAMLYEGKVIERRGEVENKNTVSDNSDIEHENICSVFSSVLYTEFDDKKLNFIDCPGSDDFVNGVISALSVVATGVMVINSQNGVEVGTEIQHRHLKSLDKAMMFVINQLDHEKSNFEGAIEQIKERFGNKVAVIQFPVNEGAGR